MQEQEKARSLVGLEPVERVLVDDRRFLVKAMGVDLRAADHGPGTAGDLVEGRLRRGLVGGKEIVGLQIDIIRKALVEAKGGADAGVVGNAAGMVAAGGQGLGQRDHGLGQAVGLAGGRVAGGIETGKDGGKGGLGPRCLGRHLCVANAIGGQGVDVGRLGSSVAIAGETIRAQGIDADEDHVGRVLQARRDAGRGGGQRVEGRVASVATAATITTRAKATTLPQR